MNAIRKMMASEINKAEESKNTLTLVINENLSDKKDAGKVTREYLNEKLNYFYNNGGPVMDI